MWIFSGAEFEFGGVNVLLVPLGCAYVIVSYKILHF